MSLEKDGLFKLTVLVAVMAGWLTGCSSMAPEPTSQPRQESVAVLQQAVADEQAAAEQENAPAAAEVDPEQVAQLLTPPLAEMPVALEPRFDIAAQDTDLNSFYMGLVEGTRYNMLVHPSVQGRVSLRLKQVTVEEVMEAIRQVYGFEYRRTGDLYQVLPATLQTEIFQVNYPHIVRKGVSDTQVSAGSLRDSSTTTATTDSSSDSSGTASSVGTRISTTSDTDFWSSLQRTLETIVSGEGRRVVVTPHSGMVVVRAMPAELSVVRDYLKSSELTLKRQVIIEAKVLEVTLSDDFQAGINWAALGKSGPGTAAFTQSRSAITNSTGLGGLFSLDISFPEFTAVIDLLNQQGDVQVLSSPRVSTVNNQKAVIKVGSDEFYVTEVSTTTTTGTTTTTTPSLELTPFFSGIALDVTPQISGEGEIVMHIHPTVSEVRDQQKAISLGGTSYDIPLALSSIRESDSVVSARSGQVVVIGGLMKSSRENAEDSLPWFAQLPGIGGLFTQQQRGGSKTELVILLRPVLGDRAGMYRELQQALKRFEAGEQP